LRGLQIVATACLGLLAGAMVLIGGAIVPYWMSLDPGAFAAWFAANSRFLAAVMVPLGALATLLAFVVALAGWRARSAARVHFGVAFALAAVVALIYLVEHASLNARIESGTLAADEIVAARQSWRTWHWARTGAGVLGFLAALVGLGRREGRP
jgi:hypothetical protein